MDGLRIPNRPKSDLGAAGPGLGATATDPAPDATASCSRTDELRRDETGKTSSITPKDRGTNLQTRN